MIFLDYRIRTPLNTIFFMVLMQFGLRNPDSTNTYYEHVCNMDSHPKDNINLPSFHSCVFMIKTLLEGTSYRTPPSKSKISSFRPFFMVLMQFGLRNPDNINTNSKHVCNIDSHFKDNIDLPNSYPCVFMILFDMNRPFFFVFKSKIQNCWNGRDYDCWLYISIVRIMKSKLQRSIFGNFTGCVRLL